MLFLIFPYHCVNYVIHKGTWKFLGADANAVYTMKFTSAKIHRNCVISISIFLMLVMYIKLLISVLTFAAYMSEILLRFFL